MPMKPAVIIVTLCRIALGLGHCLGLEGVRHRNSRGVNIGTFNNSLGMVFVTVLGQNYDSTGLESSRRGSTPPTKRYMTYGFRCVLESE